MPRHCRLNILLVGPIPPPYGGMSRQTLYLRKKLRHEQYKIKLLPVNPPLFPQILNKIRILRACIRFTILIFNLFRYIPKTDVLHIMANSGLSWYLYSFPCITLGKLFKVSILVNYRGGNLALFAKKHALVGFLLKKANAVVVPSVFLARSLENLGITAIVIPNTIDKQVIKPRKEHKPFYGLIARQLETIYGIEVAILALHKVASNNIPIHVWITGSGSQKQKLFQLVKKLNLEKRIHFLGPIPHRKMFSLFNKASLLINPSLVDNMPNVLLEAQASGIPIITTNVGGIPAMVQHKYSAYLIPPQDVEALAKAIIELYRNNSLRKKLVENGLENVKRFRWENVRSLWLSTYENLL